MLNGLDNLLSELWRPWISADCQCRIRIAMLEAQRRAILATVHQSLKSGAVAPAGHGANASFHLDYSVPVWTYEVGDQAIEARIWMEPGAHTTYAAWRLRPSPNSPDAKLSLRITLLVNGRDHHATMPAGCYLAGHNKNAERVPVERCFVRRC